MKIVTLDQVAEERKGQAKSGDPKDLSIGLEHLVPECLHVEEWDDSGKNTFTKVFCKGDILFGRRRAYLKKAAIAPFDGVCSGDITVIKSKKSPLIPELLPFVIQNDALFDYAVKNSAGSLSPRVKWEYLKTFSFRLPEKNEQQRLLEKLTSIDSEELAAQDALQAAIDMRQSLLDDAFGGKIQRYASGMESVRLSAFATKVDRKNKNLETKRVITISSQDGIVDQQEYFNKSVASKDLTGYYLLKKGEFAYNKSYSIGYPVGSIKRLDRYDEGALSNLYICFSINDDYLSDYIKLYFESTVWYAQIFGIVEEGARAHGLLNVTKSDFFATEHLLTKDRAAETSLIDDESKLSQLITSLTEKVAACHALRKALIYEAFNIPEEE